MRSYLARCLRHRHVTELPVLRTDLEQVASATHEGVTLVGHPLRVDFHATLLHHASTVAGTLDETSQIERLWQEQPLAFRRKGQLRDVFGQAVSPVRRTEATLGLDGCVGAMEAFDHFAGKDCL